jgi:hypothetical protein
VALIISALWQRSTGPGRLGHDRGPVRGPAFIGARDNRLMVRL